MALSARGPILTRRQVMQLVASVAAAAAVRPRLLRGFASPAPASAGAGYGFLTVDELAVLDAATARILPTDDLPGAREVGVVDYIQNLLTFGPGADANCDHFVTAADVTTVQLKANGLYEECPQGGDVNSDGLVDGADVTAAESASFLARPILAGGPFSGRTGQEHDVVSLPCRTCHGGATSEGYVVPIDGQPGRVLAFPPNAFREFLPLTRLQAISWRVRLLGKDALPEDDPVRSNPLLAALSEVGLRSKYREGLARLDQLSPGGRFVDLSPDDQTAVLNGDDSTLRAFVLLLSRHTIEGTLCAPEYGGNRDLLGWQMVGFSGDSQPRGNEIFDPDFPGYYRELQERPNSGPDPGEDCRGFSDALRDFLEFISSITGGGPLNDVYCFGVHS